MIVLALAIGGYLGRYNMETGIFIRVNDTHIDIGDPTLDIVALDEYVCSFLTEQEKERLIMTLLNRRQEFDEFMLK